MRPKPSLGDANLVVVSLYFAPLWGADALRSLLSPYGGFEDRSNAAAALALRHAFDFGLDGLLRVANVLASVKLLAATAFVALMIEYGRALVSGREANRETINLTIAFAVAATGTWVLSTLLLDDATLVRRAAAELLMLAGAVIVITVERHLAERRAARAMGRVADNSFERLEPSFGAPILTPAE